MHSTEGASMSAQERLSVAREALRAAQETASLAAERYGRDSREWLDALDAVSVAAMRHATLRREARRES